VPIIGAEQNCPKEEGGSGIQAGAPCGHLNQKSMIWRQCTFGRALAPVAQGFFDQSTMMRKSELMRAHTKIRPRPSQAVTVTECG
jgi:hypothetical protein